jgi:hypothetical protein
MRTKNLYRIIYWCSTNREELIMYVSGNSFIDALTAFHYCKSALVEPLEIKFISENFGEMIVTDDSYHLGA